MSGGATLLATGVGFVAALWLLMLGPAARNRVLAAAVVFLVLPPFLVTNCWLYLLGLTGVWRGWLPLNIYSLGGAIWILALLLWPIPLFATLSAWQRLEAAQLESDPALGGAKVVRWLLWPMARLSVGQATVLMFVLALNNFAVPAILQVRVFPAEIWVKFSANLDPGAALALSWPLLLFPLLLLIMWQRAELSWPRQQGSAAASAVRRQLGYRWFWGCGALTFTALLLSALPLIQILAVKRTWTELPKAFRATAEVAFNSAIFSGLAASLCICLSLAVMLRSHRKSRGRSGSAKPILAQRWGLKNPQNPQAGMSALRAYPERFCLSVMRGRGSSLSFAIWLPFLMPGVLLGIGLVWAFNRPLLDGIYRGAGIILVAWTIRFLALAWNGVAVSVQSADRDLSDAARVEGASASSVLRFALWPQMAAQLSAVWYLIYLFCLWDVETLVLIYPPGGETLALRIFNLLHYGHNVQVNALCLILLVVALAPAGVWQLGKWISKQL